MIDSSPQSAPAEDRLNAIVSPSVKSRLAKSSTSRSAVSHSAVSVSDFDVSHSAVSHSVVSPSAQRVNGSVGNLTYQSSVLQMTPKHQRIISSRHPKLDSKSESFLKSVQPSSSVTRTSPSSIPRTPLSEYNKKPLKIKLSIEYPGKEKEILAIPCQRGPRGTPKTIKWLIEEGQRRYSDIHKVNVSFLVEPFITANYP